MYREVVCIVLLLHLLNYVGAFNVEVNLVQGKLLGMRTQTIFDGRTYFAFYGVPYAQPPVGELRFKDPKAPKKWEHPFDARTEYHGACAQSHIVQKRQVYGYEDCLRLNIFTPSLSKTVRESKAVIIWIHGYAFTSSYSHIYGPDFLIDNDVILITVTHRIGVFGFLKLNETDLHANMGLKDIILALKWIRKNIKHFGGNKNNVTVMGSGSAATFLTLLLTAKHTKLFSKMILQSGALFSSPLFQGNHLLEKRRLVEKLKEKGYKNILTAPTKVILELSNKIYNSMEMANGQRPLIPFLPILEVKSNKSVLTFHPAEYLQNIGIESKPILLGFNTQEGISETIPFLQNPHYLKVFGSNFKFLVPFLSGCKHKYLSQKYNEVADKIKSGYFKEGISEKSVENFLRYITDLTKYPIYQFILSYLQISKNKMFVYKFNYNGNLNAVKATSVTGVNFKVRGAANGDEICYLLRCEPIWENYAKLIRDQNKDIIFIKQITELWANFAKLGDPTPIAYKGNFTWPPTTLMEDKILHLGNKIQLVDTRSEKKMYTFWNDIYHNYYEDCKEHDEL